VCDDRFDPGTIACSPGGGRLLPTPRATPLKPGCRGPRSRPSSPGWGQSGKALQKFSAARARLPPWRGAVETAHSPCALRFHVAAKAGWDAGGASGCPLAAGLLWAGAPISLGVLLSLVGTAAIFALLRRYYGEIGLKAVPIPGQAGGP
jgi:hypothetical protein